MHQPFAIKKLPIARKKNLKLGGQKYKIWNILKHWKLYVKWFDMMAILSTKFFVQNQIQRSIYYSLFLSAL